MHDQVFEMLLDELSIMAMVNSLCAQAGAL